jgi:hypothetical protein
VVEYVIADIHVGAGPLRAGRFLCPTGWSSGPE